MFLLVFSVALGCHAATPASVAGADDQPRPFLSLSPSHRPRCHHPRRPLKKRDPSLGNEQDSNADLAAFNTPSSSWPARKDTELDPIPIVIDSRLGRLSPRSYPEIPKILGLIAHDKNPRRQAIVPSPRRRPGSRAASISASASQPAPSWSSPSPSSSSSCPVSRLRDKFPSSITRHRFPASPDPLLF